MDSTQLTPDALRLLHECEHSDITEWAPRVQCISLKQLSTANEGATARYRCVSDNKLVIYACLGAELGWLTTAISLIISDGEFYTQAMLNTQLNHLIETEALTRFSTFKISLIANNFVSNKRYVLHSSSHVSSVARKHFE